jgi:hypothetical protein
MAYFMLISTIFLKIAIYIEFESNHHETWYGMAWHVIVCFEFLVWDKIMSAKNSVT